MNAAKKYFGRKATSDEMERAHRERAGQEIFWIKVLLFKRRQKNDGSDRLSNEGD